MNSSINLEATKSLSEVVHQSWLPILEPVEPQIHELGSFLRAETKADRSFLPPGSAILNAFTRPFDEVKVLIVGQDPYPTPNHAMGLSFSVNPEVNPLPKSLSNIFKELANDLGVPAPDNGDLSGWADQGVMLLNRVLTVRPGEPASHRGKGWESVTEHAIDALDARATPLVAILWGKQAQETQALLSHTPVISSAHPSPLSAYRGFFGSRPFSRANELLIEQGATPIAWVAK